jgi:hypothetical protein
MRPRPECRTGQGSRASSLAHALKGVGAASPRCRLSVARCVWPRCRRSRRVPSPDPGLRATSSGVKNSTIRSIECHSSVALVMPDGVSVRDKGCSPNSLDQISSCSPSINDARSPAAPLAGETTCAWALSNSPVGPDGATDDLGYNMTTDAKQFAETYLLRSRDSFGSAATPLS